MTRRTPASGRSKKPVPGVDGDPEGGVDRADEHRVAADEGPPHPSEHGANGPAQAHPKASIQDEEAQQTGQRYGQASGAVQVELDRLTLQQPVEKRRQPFARESGAGGVEVAGANPGQGADEAVEVGSEPGNRAIEDNRPEKRAGRGGQERGDASPPGPNRHVAHENVRDDEEDRRLGKAPDEPGDQRPIRREVAHRGGETRRCGGRGCGPARPPATRLRSVRDLVHGLRSGIVFSRSWEDGAVDLAALAVAPGERVLAISGAGDIPLDLAVCGASEVLAVDTSEAQLRLLALKLAAARSLDPSALRALFAAGRVPDIRALYVGHLRGHLSAEDRRYWDRHIGMFRTGLHRSNWLSIATLVLGRWIDLPAPGRLRNDILTVPDAAAQARAYRRHYQRRIFNPVSRRVLHWGLRFIARGLSDEEAAAVRDPRFLGDFERRIAARMARVLVRTDPWWCETLLGSAAPSSAQRTWLRAAEAVSLPQAVPFPQAVPLPQAALRVHPILGSVIDVIARQPAASLDAVDLSNVPDWLPLPARERLWSELERVVRPGGRILYRSLTGAVGVPRSASLAADRELSNELTQRESTGLYASVVLVRRLPA